MIYSLSNNESPGGRFWRRRFHIAAVAGACSAALMLYSTAFAAQTDLSYFIGEWSVSVKDGGSYLWTVKSEMTGEWLTGTVSTESGKTISTEHWRISGTNIERFVFRSDGDYIRVTAPGWHAGKLQFTGTVSGKNGDFRIRETITRHGENRFRAVWEKQGVDGKWKLMSDETCTK